MDVGESNINRNDILKNRNFTSSTNHDTIPKDRYQVQGVMILMRYEYIKCFWKYIDEETPVIMFYEVDLENERYATRMIEVFPNGKISLGANEGFAFVSEAPVPNVDEINQDDEFMAKGISKAEFEKMYALRSYPIKPESSFE